MLTRSKEQIEHFSLKSAKVAGTALIDSACRHFRSVNENARDFIIVSSSASSAVSRANRATSVGRRQPGRAQLLGLLIAVIVIAAMWKIFTKAGQPGWACLIPIYNIYILCKIVRPTRLVGDFDVYPIRKLHHRDHSLHRSWQRVSPKAWVSASGLSFSALSFTRFLALAVRNTRARLADVNGLLSRLSNNPHPNLLPVGEGTTSVQYKQQSATLSRWETHAQAALWVVLLEFP